MTDETQFTLGEHEGRLRALEKDVGEIKADVKKLVGYAEQGKGMGRLGAGLAGFFGALLGMAVEYFRK